MKTTKCVTGTGKEIKRYIIAVLLYSLVVCSFNAIKAEAQSNNYKRTDSLHYMERGIKAAYKNMHLVYKAFYNAEGSLQKQPVGYVAIEQAWDGDDLISRTYLDENGQPIDRVDGYSKIVWNLNNENVKYVHFQDKLGNDVNDEGINLVGDMETDSDGWSKWMMPDYNQPYTLFTIDSVYLAKKEIGDIYTCQIEIEYRDVSVKEGQQFCIKSQGMIDDAWSAGNPWWLVVYTENPPQDGILQYEKSTIIDINNVDKSKFEIGFRCDNWASGAFRVRKIKIEKGDHASEWSPGY